MEREVRREAVRVVVVRSILKLWRLRLLMPITWEGRGERERRGEREGRRRGKEREDFVNVKGEER